MGDDERRPKRSRFDQTEPEPRRHSRFDRRSRSPSSRQSETTRTRSPLSREPRSPGADALKKPTATDPAAAAGILPHLSFLFFGTELTDSFGDNPAAAAAKINAQLQAKKGIQHVDVPPIRSVSFTARAVSFLSCHLKLCSSNL